LPSPSKLQVRVVGSQAVIDALDAELRKYPADITVIAKQKLEPAGFEFGLLEAAAIAALLSAGFDMANFVRSLFEARGAAAAGNRKLVLETSYGKVEVPEDFGEERIKKLLDALQDPARR
jgi:hypothetical protein